MNDIDPNVEEESSIPLEFPKVCSVCKEQNLIKNIDQHLLTCGCGSMYCVHYASSVDPASCKDCCKDVIMTEETVRVTKEHYSEETDKVYTRVHKYRSVKFGGLDWLFFQKAIANQTDLELSMSIEYHQALYQSMLYEREKRKIDHFHRNAGKSVIIKTSTGDSISTTKIETTVKKTRTTKSTARTATEIDLGAQLQALLSKGMTAEKIMELLKSK